MRELPKTMRAIEIIAHGAPDMLQPTERPCPRPRHGELLIQVAAAGVNRPDLLQREGHYPPPPGASDLPGLEVAGIVRVCGDGVPSSWLGQSVCALVPGGGYAEYCIAVPALCLPAVTGFSVEEMAAIPENWFTAYDHVVRGCRLAKGETLLVHGGTSGVGIAAIQLGLAAGARVFATAGSDAKVAWLHRLGCTEAVNYRERDFVSALRTATDGIGIDVIVDMVAGPYLARNIDLLAERGRISLIGGIGGVVADGISIAPIMLKQAMVTGNVLRTRPAAYKAELAASLHRAAWPLFERGDARPVIDRSFPLDRAADAHRLMESSAHIGKIVLIPGLDEHDSSRSGIGPRGA